MIKKLTNFKWLISLLLVAFWGYGFAQVSVPTRESGSNELFLETFEANSPTLNSWTQQYESSEVRDWTFGPGAGAGSINTAFEGSANARFVTGLGFKTKLISPVLDLSSAVSPRISFYLAQEVWDGDNNILKVYYRISGSSSWVQLEAYTTRINEWTEMDIALPDPSATYQIAFEGSAHWGRPNVIDLVTVYTDDTPAGEGIFNGYVYDQATNDAIEGAMVNFEGTDENYSVLTGDDGAYNTVATSGEYSITVSAGGYVSQTLENVVLANDGTVTNDFTLIKFNCEDFDGPEDVEAEIIDQSAIMISWSNIENPNELVKITQNPGVAEIGAYQYWNYVYGVAYDISAYPDAILNNMNFHHKGWGTTGTWEYKIHVYNWDNRTLLKTVGLFTTTGEDKWENVALQDLNLGGASKVAILMEPMSNMATDAYPNLAADNATDPQGSIWGKIAQINELAPSTMGNWLMEAYIYTAYGDAKTTPLTLDLVQAPKADLGCMERKNNHPVANNAGITSTGAKRVNPDAVVGANVYRDGVLIAEAITDFSYLDVAVEPGDHTYCVTYVYENGGESCPDANCVEVSLTVDVKSNDLTQIRVYPNPTNSTLNIDFTNNVNRVIIYNYVGQIVLDNNITDKTSLQIDVSNYENGAYLVRFITSQGQSLTKKVMVTK